MADQVVDVAGDFPPLGKDGLLGELAPGGFELSRQLDLAT